MVQKGHLDVGGGHALYYEQHGNRKGIPVLFILGGPGLGSSPANRDFFDLETINLIQYEQRGCGRSLPKGGLENNTSQDLIEDINKLLDYLSIDKVILFGGSWGSTLSLLYAIHYPNRVSSMVLRGVFTASKSDRKHFETGGNKRFFPQIWQRFINNVPRDHKGNPSYYYFLNILNGPPALQKKLAYELMYYGIAVSIKSRTFEAIDAMLTQSDYLQEAKILAHYSIHDFFLKDEYIMNNLSSIEGIPSYIVQGRYDMITTPDIAYHLHEKLENSQLFIVESGHSQGEEETKRRLTSIMKTLTISK